VDNKMQEEKRFYLAHAKHTWDHLIQQIKSRLFVNLEN